VYAEIRKRRNLEAAVKYGDDAATAKARLARRDVFSGRPYVAGFKPTSEDEFLERALMIDRCRVMTDNSQWIKAALNRGVLLAQESDSQTISAAFALLVDAENDRDFVMQWLPRFEPFVKAGKLDREAYARQVDSYAIGTGKPQIYGSFQTCRGEYDRSKVHAEGLPVAREILMANRTALDLPPLDSVEKITRDHCLSTFPFSI
jgi:hypothetical protein